MELGESKDHTSTWQPAPTHKWCSAVSPCPTTQPCTRAPSCCHQPYTCSHVLEYQQKIPKNWQSKISLKIFILTYRLGKTKQNNSEIEGSICSGMMWETDDDRTLAGFSYVPLRKESGLFTIPEYCSLDEVHMS